MAENSSSMQLIDGEGALNASNLDNFVQSQNLKESGISYVTVAILGPQSSGKSTLLNHLFSTNFEMMDVRKGRSQTTQGIWAAKAVGVETFTIVMDVEGNDGRERGQDHSFEKKTALFALVVADIVLINMSYGDVGRETGANKPLLRTVFEAVTKLFNPRQTRLLFVIRDYDEDAPLDILRRTITTDTDKIWKEVIKPGKHQNAALGDFFTVEVIALPNYKFQKEKFIEQVEILKQRFSNSMAPGGLAGDRKEQVPAGGYSYHLQQIWEIIINNKDLDLPAHKVMVASFRCDEIAKEKLSRLRGDKDWLELEDAAKSGLATNFGKQLS